MSKKLILTICLAFSPLLMLGQAGQQKVGVMNPEQVMEALPETARIQSELEEFIQQRQQEFTQVYSTYIETVTNYEEGLTSGTLSDEARTREEQRLAEMEEQLTNMEQRIQNQIQARQNELIGPVMQRVEEAMQTVARELDLDYVLNRQTSQGDPLIYYVSENGVDITDRVIEELTSN